MNDEINYQNNPLHGVSLKNLLIEMVDHYGFEILFAYLNINCFKTNPGIESSVKFLKKTDWAREKVEVFYLYEFKNLPRASSEQFKLPARKRIIPAHQSPGEPAKLSLEDAVRLNEKRAKKAAEHKRGAGYRAGPGKRSGPPRGGFTKKPKDTAPAPKVERAASTPSDSATSGPVDPWAKWKN